MPPEWNRHLNYKRGGLYKLEYIPVYYDFDWYNVFLHNKAMFPGGMSLARLVKNECPNGKTPCLLLTDQFNIHPHRIETEVDFFFVVPIQDYLSKVTAGADLAASYCAGLSGTPLTQLSALSESDLGKLLDEQLTPEALASWLERSPNQIEILRNLVAGEADLVPVDIASALRGLEVEDIAVLEELINYVTRIGGGTQLAQFLTESETGRAATVSALVDKLPDRIADIRRHLADYNALIANPESTETNVQHLLEVHPWIVGLPYVRTRARVPIPRGELDFVLYRYDGFFDVMELKSPQDVIIEERQSNSEDVPPSASAYSLSRALSGALAQAHHYREILDRSGALSAQYGLNDSRQPRILIVLGSSVSLNDQTREILRQLNLSLHRVEIIPYDLLGTRTLGLLNNLESLIFANQ